MPTCQWGRATSRKSAAGYRSFFDNAVEGLFRSIPEGRFTEVNPALVSMLGYASAVEDLALTPPDNLCRQL
jgi:PAS domain-containing protein